MRIPCVKGINSIKYLRLLYGVHMCVIYTISSGFNTYTIVCETINQISSMI